MKNRFLTVLAVVGAVHLLAGGVVLAVHLVQQPASAPPGAPSETTDYQVRQTSGPAVASRPPTPSPASAAPAARASSPAPAAASTATHTVAPGEGYIVIARKHGVTVDQLLAANGHSKDRTLRVGETLRLPASATP